MSKNISFSMEGLYNSVSDIVRARLRFLEEQETRLAALRAALIDGEESGVSTRSVKEIWARVKERSGITGG